MLRKGGDEMKSVARGGLNGTDAELATAADPQYWQGTALSAAYKKDHDAGSAKMDELYGRNDVWKQSLNQEPLLPVTPRSPPSRTRRACPATRRPRSSSRPATRAG